jgi:hypothetical protein
MKSIKALLLIVFFLCCWLMPERGAAQTAADSTGMYRIETRDGNEFIGTIINQTPENVQFRTQKLGVITIPRSDIKSMLVIDAKQMKDGKLWFENPQATRYLFAPNAYGLRPGEGYYQNVWIFINQASVGVTKNFSIGVGLVPLFLFGEGGSTPIWLLPKVSVPVIEDKFNVGGGALIGTVIGEDAGSFGIAYGLTTFGSKDRNATFGLGYGFAGGEWASSPLITVSGMYRTGPRGYLITENYFIGIEGESAGIISIGGRRIIKKIGIDFGIFRPMGSDVELNIIGLPFLGLTVPFGQGKSSIVPTR